MRQQRYDDKAKIAQYLKEARAFKVFKLEPRGDIYDYECFGCGKHGIRFEIYFLSPESHLSVEEWQKDEHYFNCDNMRLGPDCAKKIAKLAGIKLN